VTRSCRPLPLALVALAVGLAPAVRGQEAAEHDYVGVRKCRTCHGKELMGDQVATWRAGPHRRAFETLKSEESKAIAERLGVEGPPPEADACLSCHATAHGVPPLRMAYTLELADGVQCESCHGPGRDYRRKKIMSEVERARKRGLWNAGEDPSICTACHNERSPTFDPARYTLPNGGSAGFDFEQAKERIAHSIPADVRGPYVELEREEKARRRAAEGR
jgi:hypothetical protein